MLAAEALTHPVRAPLTRADVDKLSDAEVDHFNLHVVWPFEVPFYGGLWGPRDWARYLFGFRPPDYDGHPFDVEAWEARRVRRVQGEFDRFGAQHGLCYKYVGNDTWLGERA